MIGRSCSAQAEAVAELQAEGRHLVREAELLRLRPHARRPCRSMTPGLIRAMALSSHSRAFL